MLSNVSLVAEKQRAQRGEWACSPWARGSFNPRDLTVCIFPINAF